MKSVLLLAGLWSTQGRLFDRPSPRPKMNFLGSGERHSGENFHAVISAQSMEDVKKLTVQYSDCGESVACRAPEPLFGGAALPLSGSNPVVTDTQQLDGDYKIFDVEYTYTGGTLRNHILTIFSDNLGEESIICGVGSEINTGESENACNDCAAGSTFAELYDAQCKNCTQTCEDGKRVTTACTKSTDTTCSNDCISCTGVSDYFATACDHGSASVVSSTPGTCQSCLADCTGNYYVQTECNKGTTSEAGSPATCATITQENTVGPLTHYLVEAHQTGTAFVAGHDNDWEPCSTPGKNQYVSSECNSQSDTVIANCTVCADQHRLQDTACVQGDKNNKGKDTDCGDCLQGFALTNEICVSKSYMFGYVIRKDPSTNDATCAKECVKWSGTLNDNFAEDKINSQKPSAAICALLSDREPLLHSSECPR